MKLTAICIGTTGPVEGIDILAVVLDARAVDIECWLVKVPDSLAEEAMPALGLAERKGRVGNIDE